MAQGSLSTLQTTTTVPTMASVTSTTILTEEEQRQLAECKRIIRFGNEVLSGGHSRIKVPAHLYASKQSSASRSPQPSAAPVLPGSIASLKNVPTGPRITTAKNAGRVKEQQVAGNLHSFNSNAHFMAAAASSSSVVLPGLDAQTASLGNMPSTQNSLRASVGHRSSEHSGNVQFDPVLLTKSDDLIKAELHLQRQRLERVLCDHLQQHRVTSKPSQHADTPADFDLADVLMKALQLVQTPALTQTDTHLAANTSGTDSDSADNDTFYSSKHDTPESHLTHRVLDPADGSDYAQAREGSHYEPPMVMEASPIPNQPSMVASAVLAGDAMRVRQFAFPHSSVIHTGRDQERAEMSQTHETVVPMEVISSEESEGASSSRNSGPASGAKPGAQRRLEPVTQQLIERAYARQQSPILRAHNLSPVAPQPAHVSPLAISHQAPAPQQEAPPLQATPAQVAALRNDHSNGSSPESSPQGRGNKKNKKGKKRKSDRLANNVASPYIKPEPRSPSPMSSLPYSRPNKRPRQAQRHGQDLIYDEAPPADTLASAQPPTLPIASYRDDRDAAYASPNSHHMRQGSRSVVLTESPRYEREYRDEFRPVETIRYVRRVSPPSNMHQFSPSEVRTIRSISRAAMERPYSYHDVRDPPRTVVRPATDRARSRSPIAVEERAPTVMGPPRLPASRVVVDEFGREYIDPSSRQEPVIIRRSVAPRPMYGELDECYDPRRTTTRVVRRSVAPASAHGEPEIVYEQRAPPPRAVSTMPAPGRYDDEIVYHRPTSPTARYTTMRRVVTRPEYALPEHRYYRERDYPSQPPTHTSGDFYEVRGNDPPREYIVRSTSVRPEMPTRPEVMRMSSVRPETIPGEYGAPIHPDPQSRAYSVRTMAAPPLPQQSPYTRQWPEYETGTGYADVERREEGGFPYVEGVQRDLYR